MSDSDPPLGISKPKLMRYASSILSKPQFFEESPSRIPESTSVRLGPPSEGGSLAELPHEGRPSSYLSYSRYYTSSDESKHNSKRDNEHECIGTLRACRAERKEMKAKKKHRKIIERSEGTAETLSEILEADSLDRLSTEVVRGVSSVMGIPTFYRRDKINVDTIWTLLIFALFAVYLLIKLKEEIIIHRSFLLPQHSNAHLHLGNCLLSFKRAPAGRGYSSFTVMAWPFRSIDWSFGALVYLLLPSYLQYGLSAAGWQPYLIKTKRKIHTMAGYNIPPLSLSDPVFFQDNPFNNEGQDIHVQLQMHSMNQYFSCALTFELEEDYEFDAIRIDYRPDLTFVNVTSTVDITAKSLINIDVMHAELDFLSLAAASISLSMTEGHFKASFLAASEKYFLSSYAKSVIDSHSGTDYGIHITSKHAAVEIVSNKECKISTMVDVAQRSILRAREVLIQSQDHEYMTFSLSPKRGTKSWTSFFPLHSNSPSSGLNFAASDILNIQYIGSQAPIYLYVTDDDAGIETEGLYAWLGSEQPVTPHFDSNSVTKTQFVSNFIQGSGSHPWTVRVRIHGSGLPRGHWKIVSSFAYATNSTWIPILSGGLLKPNNIDVNMHILGLFCRKPSNSDDMAHSFYSSSSGVSPPDASSKSSTGRNPKIDSRSIRQSQIDLAFPEYSTSESRKRSYTEIYPDDVITTSDNGYILKNMPANGTHCTKNLLEDEFRVLWSSISTLHISSVLPIWRDADDTAITFDIRDDAVILDSVNRGTELWLNALIGLNVLICTAFGIAFAHKYHVSIMGHFFGTLITESTGDYGLSHRLDLEPLHNKASEWHINVFRTHGRMFNENFTIRWSFGSTEDFYKIGVRVRPVQVYDKESNSWSDYRANVSPEASDQRGSSNEILKDETKNEKLDPQEIQRQLNITFELLATQENILLPDETMVVFDKDYVTEVDTLGGCVKQLCFPVINPMLFKRCLHSNQRWSLQVNHKYRFQLIALDKSGKALNTSAWSSEVRVDALWSPIKLWDGYTRIIMPGKKNTLKSFLRRHLQFVKHEANQIQIKNIRITKQSTESQPFQADDIRSEILFDTVFDRDGRRREKLKIDPTRKFVDDYQKAATHNDLVEFEKRLALRESLAFEIGDNMSMFKLILYVGSNISDANTRMKVLDQSLLKEISLCKNTDPSSPIHLFNLTEECLLELRCESESTINVVIVDHFGDIEAEGRLNMVSVQEAMADTPMNKDEFMLYKFDLLKPETKHIFGSMEVELRSSLFNPCIAPTLANKRATTAQFLQDLPGHNLHHGSDWIIHWRWNGSSRHSVMPADASEVYIHIFDHNTNEYLGAIHHGRPIPNTGSFSWVADADVQTRPSNPVFFAITLDPWLYSSDIKVLARSNGMFLRKYLLLSELELAYSSYCRGYSMEQEPLSEEVLKKFNIMCSTLSVRVCKDLRNPLAFEMTSSDCVRCPGQIVVSPLSKLVYFLNDNLSSNSSDKETVSVFKSQAMSVTIVDDFMLSRDPFWWEDAMDFEILTNDMGIFMPFGATHDLMLIPYQSPVQCQYRRFLQYELGGSVVLSFMNITCILFFGYLSICPFIFVVLYNYISASNDVTTYDHTEVNPDYYCDYLMLSFSQMLRSNSQHFLFASLTTLLFWASMMVLVLLKICNTLYQVKHQYQYVLTVVATLQGFFITACLFFLLSSYLLWILVTGLICSSILLPACVIIGFLAFVIYRKWTSFTSARSQIRLFVKNNLDHLVAISFDTWFESLKIPNPTSEALGARAKGIDVKRGDFDSKESMRFELVQAKRRAKHEVLMWQDKEREEQPHVAKLKHDLKDGIGAFGGVNQPLATQFIGEANHTLALIEMTKSKYRKFCIRKVSVNFFSGKQNEFGQYFSFDEATGMLKNANLETMAGFPKGTRLATCDDFLSVLKEKGTKLRLLHGDEVVACGDGYITGPGGGYVMVSSTHFTASDWKREYAAILAAVPVHPPARFLSPLERLALLFDLFNESKTGYLSPAEMKKMWRRLKKGDVQDWDMWFDIFSETYISNYRTAGPNDVDQRHVTLSELELYYSSVRGLVELDNDYTSVFSDFESLFQETSDDREHIVGDADILMSLSGESGDEKFNHLKEGPLYHKDTVMLLNSDDESSDSDDELGIDIRNNDDGSRSVQKTIHLYKVKVMFEYLTRSSFADRQAQSMSRINLATNILESQFRHLCPVFNRNDILGINGDGIHPSSMSQTFIPKDLDGTINEDDLVLRLSKGNRPSHLLNHILALQLVETQRMIQLKLGANSLRIGGSDVIYARVRKFYDVSIADAVRSKAGVIVNDKIPVSGADAHPKNKSLLNSYPPRTSFHVIDLMNVFRIEHGAWLQWKCQSVNLSKASSDRMKISLVTRVLIQLGLLSLDCDVVELPFNKETAPSTVHHISPPGGSTAELHPRYIESKRYLLLTLNQIVDDSGDDQLMPEHIVKFVRHVCTQNLWLHGFHMLIRLMGFDPLVEELPISLSPTELNQVAAWVNQHDEVLLSQSFVHSRDSYLTYRRNCVKVKKIFDQLSGRTNFLPINLTDEAFAQLTNNRLHIAAVHVCLESLQLSSCTFSAPSNTESTAGSVCAQRLNTLGLFPHKASSDIEPSNYRPPQLFDWMNLSCSLDWPVALLETFQELTRATPGFISLSQMLEFSQIARQKLQLVGSSSHSSKEADEHARRLPDPLVSFEVFAMVIQKLRLSISRRQSEIFWSLITHQTGNPNRLWLPSSEIALQTVRILFCPIEKSTGQVADVNNVLEGNRGLSVEYLEGLEFKGVINYTIFSEFLRRVDVDLPHWGVRRLWADMPKDNLDISPFLPEEFFNVKVDDNLQKVYRTLKILRLDMDIHGLDLSQGMVISVESLCTELPKRLIAGLWPEALKSLIYLNFKIESEVGALEEAVEEQPKNSRNRYGLIKPGCVEGIVDSLHDTGISLEVLYDIVKRMDLRLQKAEIRRMFNIMDSNQDKTLDKDELFNGFTLLFGNVLPDLVIDAVRLDTRHQVSATFRSFFFAITFFTFVSLGFYVFSEESASNAMQSFLAILAALSFQTTSLNHEEYVNEQMIQRMEKILGQGLEKKIQQHRDLAEIHKAHATAMQKSLTNAEPGNAPSHLRYLIPQKHLPNSGSANRCLTFR
eukprot:GHVH01009988.1.p1 GENE.GHVH01009988.1~~GHVH01009988.1.p1  ORF type:complete len:3135 (+),score=485.08 GHVH01009988.1:217-9621(+)